MAGSCEYLFDHIKLTNKYSVLFQLCCWKQYGLSAKNRNTYSDVSQDLIERLLCNTHRNKQKSYTAFSFERDFLLRPQTGA